MDEGVNVPVPEPVGVDVGDTAMDEEKDGVTPGVSAAVNDAVTDPVSVDVAEGVPVGVTEVVDVPVGVGDFVLLVVTVGVGDARFVGVCDTDAPLERVKVSGGVFVTEPDSVVVGDPVMDAVGEGVDSPVDAAVPVPEVVAL